MKQPLSNSKVTCQWYLDCLARKRAIKAAEEAAKRANKELKSIGKT